MKDNLQVIYESQFFESVPEYVLATGHNQQAYAGYVDWKGIIVWNTPERFLSLAVSIPERALKDPTTIERINSIIIKIQSGVPLDPLVILTQGDSVVGHEGRHRAYACIKLGIKKVPILVIPTDFPRVPQWTSEMKAKVQSLNYVKERI